MDKLKSIPVELPACIEPTFAAMVPPLHENAAKIKSQYNKMETHAYGQDPQQELDIYYPAQFTDSTPILLFLFGGNKQNPAAPDLIFANLGAFFVSHGFITSVANYRLVSSPFGPGNGKYPSGGEDVALALSFLKQHLGGKQRDVCLMGNSAGAAHVMTYLFEPTIVNNPDNQPPKAAVLIAPPCHQRSAEPVRQKVNSAYYGSPEEIEARSPLSLMEKMDGVLEKTRILGLVGTLEEPSIERSWGEFYRGYKGKGGDVEEYVMEGHNHISPVAGLMSTDPKAGVWGEDVVKWLGRVGFDVR